MPTDFRSGNSNYSRDEFYRRIAAGYGGLKTPAPYVKQQMLGQLREAIKGLGSEADDPAAAVVKQRQREQEEL